MIENHERKYNYSIIIVTYNPDWDKFILTLDATIHQRYVSFEIIICDDGSKNNYESDLREYFYMNNFSNYKLVMNKENQGIVKNVLSGVRVANGEYLKLISPGDYFYDEEVLHDFLLFINKNPAEVYFGKAIYYRDEKSEVGNLDRKIFDINNPRDITPYVRYNQKKIRFNYIYLRDYILGASFIIEREIHKNYLEQLEDKVIYCEDCSVIAMIADNKKVAYFDKPFIWYEYGFGISTQKNQEWEKKLNEDNKVAFTILKEKKSISRIEYDVYYGKSRVYRRLLRCIFVYPKLFLRKIWNYK